MRTRRLGRTPLHVSELGLGTWGLLGGGYGTVAEDVAKDVVQRALALGITLFDVSDSYGGGRAEVSLGQWLPADVCLVTRIGIDATTEPRTRRFSEAFLRQRVEASLRRQKRERLDVCMLHHPALEDVNAGALDVLRAMRAEGKIAHIGAAVTAGEVGRAALRAGAEVLTIPYNLTYLNVYDAVSGDVQVEEAGLLAHSVLAYGLLSGSWTRGMHFDEGDHRADRWLRHELDERLTQIESLRFLVRGSVSTLKEAAVRFPLSQEVTSSVLLGPRTRAQLEDLVRGAGTGPTYLSDSACRELFRTLERLGLDP